MKILQVISSLNPAGGGPVEGLIQQGNVMIRAGHDVHTLALDSPDSPFAARIESGAVHALGPSFFNYGFCPRLAPWLREHGREYDVIIVHGMWQFHGYCVAKVARQLGLRYVVFAHGMLDPWFASEYPLKHMKKWLYWPWAEYRVLRDARRVLFTTAEELALARQSFWLYRVREKLVGYGIQMRTTPREEAREAFLAQFPSMRGRRILLFLSRIHEKKGCDLLIHAFAKVANADPLLHLVMAGPDQTGWVDKLTAQAASLGMGQRITFTGMLSGELKWGAMDACEVFILPSHQENFGMVVAEALCSGVPVLTTNKVNIWREIQAAGAGMVQPDTQAGIDQLLLDWLALPADERAQMAGNAVACFQRHFELEKVTEKLLCTLQEVAADVEIAHTFPT